MPRGLFALPTCSLLNFLLLLPFIGMAQSPQEVIHEFQSLMQDRYIDLDQAKEVNAHLDQLLVEGYFDDISEAQALADSLTKQIREITKDYHLAIRAPRRAGTEKPVEAPDPLQSIDRYRPSMVNGYQYFDHNVGYFDMRYFGGGPAHTGQLDEVMAKLSKADAIIIDVRNSMGGSPSTVQYLCSYFFDEDMLLSSIYSRPEDHTEEYRTVQVEGQKRPDVPLFILTSDRSFSAAEDLPYTLQGHGRAIIVGEVTRGGAHPTRSHGLAGGFRAYIPFAKSIHPITQTNWEGVGITPNVEVPEEKALSKAKELAALAALAYKDAIFKPLLDVLDRVTDESSAMSNEAAIHQQLDQMVSQNRLNESDINRIGYNHFLANNKQAASLLFKSNTLLYPESANAYDSYAEVLAEMGQRDQALIQYQKAVELAKLHNHPNLEAYQQNLATFEQQRP